MGVPVGVRLLTLRASRRCRLEPENTGAAERTRTSDFFLRREGCVYLFHANPQVDERFLRRFNGRSLRPPGTPTP